jgi:hypothetical protein
MLLNVFEIVYAKMPEGEERKIWVKYFEDTLNRCPVTADLLDLKGA